MVALAATTVFLLLHPSKHDALRGCSALHTVIAPNELGYLGVLPCHDILTSLRYPGLTSVHRYRSYARGNTHIWSSVARLTTGGQWIDCIVQDEQAAVLGPNALTEIGSRVPTRVE